MVRQVSSAVVAQMASCFSHHDLRQSQFLPTSHVPSMGLWSVVDWVLGVDSAKRGVVLISFYAAGKKQVSYFSYIWVRLFFLPERVAPLKPTNLFFFFKTPEQSAL